MPLPKHAFYEEPCFPLCILIHNDYVCDGDSHFEIMDPLLVPLLVGVQRLSFPFWLTIAAVPDRNNRKDGKFNFVRLILSQARLRCPPAEKYVQRWTPFGGNREGKTFEWKPPG